MSRVQRIYAAATRAVTRLRTAAALAGVPGRITIAEFPRCVGVPYLDIRGSIRMGRGVTLFSSPVRTHLVVHRGGRVDIGDNVQIGFGCGIASHSQITIGSGTVLGPYVMVLDSDYHVAGDPKAHALPLPIFIGRNVRIGTQVTILRGTHIEDGAYIESGSVVSGRVAAGSHVRGVPARVVEPTREVTQLETTEAAVQRVAMQVFQLSEPPRISSGPDEIPRWDSLGALSFLLALEECFQLTLNFEEAASVRQLADVVAVVQRARAARAAARTSSGRSSAA